MRKKRAIESGQRNNRSEPSKICTIGERKTYEIFFRSEHPDTRTVKEWLRAVNRRMKSKWFVNGHGKLQR